MVKRVGIRTKLLALVAAPMALFIALSVFIVGQYGDDVSNAGRQQTVANVLPVLSGLLDGLQQERAVSLAELQPTKQSSAAGTNTLNDARKKTDKALGELSAQFNGDLLKAAAPEAAYGVTNTAGQMVRQLKAARGDLDAGRANVTGLRASYDAAIARLFTVPPLLGDAMSDGTLAHAIRDYMAMLQVQVYAVDERDLVNSILASHSSDPVPVQQENALARDSDAATSTLLRTIATDFPDRATTLRGALDAKPLDPFRAPFAADTTPGKGIDAPHWTVVADSRISRLRQAGPLMANDIIAMTAARATAAQRAEYGMILGAVIVLLAVAALTYFLSQRITRPLRHLTEAAKAVSTRLPAMVEHMQRPGDKPSIELERLPVTSQDEVGRLTEAFNAVNDVTLQVAEEQAALRGSIAEMFTNMARRNQVLLDRQLAFLDRLEAREEDPDTLENLFRLDHLATRMRRNSEGLLVLAGIDAARKLRTPMPLSDVIRSAIGGIEAYDRVDLSLVDDPMVSGRVAMSVSHLFAELLENATHFSNPDTRVWVTANTDREGMMVVVRDAGLGMTDEELREANERISNPPVTELAVAQRLGFFVVGRLAQRLEAPVRLSHGPRGGVVAEIVLPSTLFVGMATPQAPVEPVSTVDAVPPMPFLDQPEYTVVPAEDDHTLPSRVGAVARDIPATPLDAPIEAPIATPIEAPSTAPAAPQVDELPSSAPAEPVQVSGVSPQPTVDAGSARESFASFLHDVPAPVGEAPTQSVDGPASAGESPAAPPVHLNPAAAMTILPSHERGSRLRRRDRVGHHPAPLPSGADGAVPTPEPAPRRFHRQDVVVPAELPSRPHHEIAPAPTDPLPIGLSPMAELSQLASESYTPEVVRPAPPRPIRPPMPTPETVRTPVPPVRAVEPVADAVVEVPQPAPAAVSPQPETESPAAVTSPVAPPPAVREIAPESVPEPPPLARRQPVKVGALGAADVVPAIPRHRAAADVRSMLSGFRAGVQRGREGAAVSADTPTPDSDHPRKD